jgi:multidrug resistance efflux pump
MFIILLMLVLAVAGVWVARSQRTLGSSLEQYIIDNNPQHTGDVERLTVEYNMKVKRGEI